MLHRPTRSISVSVSIATLFPPLLGLLLAAQPASGQTVLKQLEERIRAQVRQEREDRARLPAAASSDASTASRGSGYLGAVVDNARGGVVVRAVRDQSPAARAGIQQGDLITGLAGVRIRTLRQMADLMQRLPAGSRMAVDVLRGGRSLKLDVTLAAKPAATERRDDPSSTSDARSATSGSPARPEATAGDGPETIPTPRPARRLLGRVLDAAGDAGTPSSGDATSAEDTNCGGEPAERTARRALGGLFDQLLGGESTAPTDDTSGEAPTVDLGPSSPPPTTPPGNAPATDPNGPGQLDLADPFPEPLDAGDRQSDDLLPEPLAAPLEMPAASRPRGPLFEPTSSDSSGPAMRNPADSGDAPGEVRRLRQRVQELEARVEALERALRRQTDGA